MARVHAPDERVHDPLSYIWSQYTPEIGAAAAAYSLKVYEHSRLSLREMEAARMRTALINGCHPCRKLRAGSDLPIHIAISGGDASIAASSRDNTLTDENSYAQIVDWRKAKEMFSPRERLAIEYAEELGEAPQCMDEDEEFWAAMHDNFSNGDIVDLTFAIGSWIALDHFAHVLALDAGFSSPRCK